MKRYVVIFEKSAQENVRESYDWGCRVWGKKEAQQWVRDLRTAILRQLSVVPKGFPLAPEDDEFAQEIRHFIVGRYRVLFTIRRAKFTSFMFGCLPSELNPVSSRNSFCAT